MTTDEAIYALGQDLGKRERAQVFASLAIYLELSKGGRLRTVAETAPFRRHGADIPYDESGGSTARTLCASSRRFPMTTTGLPH
jgi:hypothetical protein